MAPAVSSRRGGAARPRGGGCLSRWTRNHGPRLHLGRRGSQILPRPYTLSAAQLADHRHMLGTSGVGKSALMASMFVQLHSQGVGSCVVDPHSDLALDCLRGLLDRGYFTEPGAFDRLLYVDFRRTDAYLPFNVLDQPYPDHAVADWLVEVCARAWPALGGGAAPTFENLVRHAVVLLRQNGRLPLTQLARVLVDRPYREELLAGVSDPQVHRFFRDRVDRWGREAALMKESSLNRADLLTFHPTLRYSLGQRRNALDFRALMDRGVSLIVNLGGLPEQVQRFLGAFICSGFEVAALSRADLPPERRPHYEIFLDEYSMFCSQTESGLARILSLCRKYGLILTMAHQTASQVSERMAGALQNAVTVGFRMGRADAEWAGRHFGRFAEGKIKHEVADPLARDRTHPVYVSLAEQAERWVKSIEDLDRGEAFVRLGSTTTKIRTRILPPAQAGRTELDAVVERYAARLMTPAATVVPEVDGDARPAPSLPPLPRRARAG